MVTLATKSQHHFSGTNNHKTLENGGGSLVPQDLGGEGALVQCEPSDYVDFQPSGALGVGGENRCIC